MSFDTQDAEVYKVYDEKSVKARKQHHCHACKQAISAGQKYWRIGTVSDHSANTIKRCNRCQTLHLHLRQKFETEALGIPGSWPSDYLDCGIPYEQEWGDCPDHIAALAFALPSEQQ